jgi:uncharacterized protein (TIGR02145 family)
MKKNIFVWSFISVMLLAVVLSGCQPIRGAKELLSPPPSCPIEGQKICNKQCVDPLTDIDGNTYKVVTIGDQCWMAENLKVSHYASGDLIPQISSQILYWNDEAVRPEGWVNYAWNSSNDAIYGKIYSWPVITNSKGLCPVGWHVPSDEEFTKLEGFADTIYEWDSQDPGWTAIAPAVRGFDCGKKLKSITGWTEILQNTDDFGFNAIPGGYKRNNAYPFYGRYWYSVFWTSTPGPNGPGWLRMYSTATNGVPRGYGPVGNSPKGPEGAYVRCIKDSTVK